MMLGSVLEKPCGSVINHCSCSKSLELSYVLINEIFNNKKILSALIEKLKAKTTLKKKVKLGHILPPSQ